MTIHRAAALVLVAAISSTALAQEKYTIRYVEIAPLGNGTTTVRFVEKEADSKEVLKELKSSDKYRRLDALKAVEYPESWAKADRKAIIEAIGERLTDDDPAVRYRASKALEYVGPDAASVLPALMKAAENDESLIKLNAIGAIGIIGPSSKPAIPLLQKLLDSDERFIAMYAADALAGVGQEAVPPLIEALKSKKSETRNQAIDALSSMGTEARSAIPALKQIATDGDMFARFQVQRAIERIGQPSDHQLWAYGKRLKHELRTPSTQKD